MIACPSCGAPNEPGRKFCGECGHSLAVACPSCGTPNPPSVKFCGECGAALRPTVSAEPEPPATERRVVSVLFADLVGFTPLSESRDAEDVRELLSRYFDTCRRLIGLYGGTVEKFIGDAVMAVWGAPLATEDDAERAVRAGLDLVAAVSALGDELGAPELRARAAVLTGEAAVTLGAVGEGMVAGDLVNTAARVQAAAAPGTVFVGEATRRATDRAIAYEDAGAHELKGKEERTRLWRALRVVSARGGELRSERLEAPFVGRERELRQLKELFHLSASERRAHLVSITGIAGIGKSRLAWEFYKYFDGIVEPVFWHRGRCLAYGEGVTYWALADMVRMRCQIAEDEDSQTAAAKLHAVLYEQLLDADERRFVEPRLARLLGIGETDGGDRDELFAAWRLFFERLADSAPVVLVFEDLQWADASLLDFVAYLLEWSRGHPIFVVTLARPELHERRPGWGAAQRGVTPLYLEPLAEQAMRELLAGLVPGLSDELVDHFVAHAEGVPLYAVETVRMLLDRDALVEDGATYSLARPLDALEVPETLHALVAARLDGLPERERRLLQDAAVLGKTFTRQAVAALAGLPETEIEPSLASLVRKEVLFVQADARSPERGHYGFLQDLVRRVAYETLSRRDRRGRHLAAAAELDRAGGDEAAEIAASHLLAAYEALPDAPDALEVRALAVATLLRAGDRARSLGAAAEARRYFERAAGLTDDPRERADLAHRAGAMAFEAGSPAEARELLDQAHAAFVERGDVRAAARVSASLAMIDFQDGHPLQAVARLEPAVAALESGEPDADLAAAAEKLGRYLTLGGEYDRAAPYLERALILAEALDLPETLAEALNTRSIALARRGRPFEARLLLRGALDVALAHDLHAAAVRAYNNLAVTLWTNDRWRETDETNRRGAELAHRAAQRNWELAFQSYEVATLSMLGDWDGALERATEIETAPTEFIRSSALWAVPILAARGETGEARRLVERHAEGARSENDDIVCQYATFEAALLRAEGRPQEALAAADRALAASADSGSGPRNLALAELLEASAALGDDDRMRDSLSRLPVLGVTPFLKAQRARFEARLTPAEALASLERAEQVLAELGLPFHLAVVRLERAEHLLVSGRRNEAEQLLAEAGEEFERLRATPWLERLEAARAGRPAHATI